jgi:Protein of unknown function (DUF2723)
VRKLVGTLAVVSLAAHLAVLPPTLEDLDSVNFALGVRQFDVAHHQPHPPGYPIFIALGRVGTSALARAGVAMPDVRGLAIWSALAAGVIPLLFFVFFRALTVEERALTVGENDERGDRRAAIAALLTVCSPLLWFTGARPLSDLAGLAAAWAALAALAVGSDLVFQHVRRTVPGNVEIQDLTPRWIILGAFMAGLSIGFRSQMAILTMPLLVWVFVAVARARVAMIAAAAAGVAVWAVPLVWLSGGPSRYLQALGSQAGEDFSGVVMLWTHPTPRAAAAAILQTFVRPWDSPILAGVMLALAAAGAILLLVGSPRVLAILAVVFGPYAVFHLLFQETHTIRYALPLVPLIGYLAAVVLTEADARAAGIGAVALAGACLACVVPATAAYGRTPSPTFALLSEMRMLQERGAQPVVGMHRRVFTESRRARLYAGDVPGTLLPSPRDYEWLEMTRAWREGHDGETWFVADPRRTDLALIDSEHARTRPYRWPFKGAVYVGGARPDQLDWHIVSEPGWFLEQGWALTPETAGIADRDGWGPHRRPSIGWVRRRATDAVMMIGGRHLGGDPPVSVVVSLDDRPVTTMVVRPGFFFDFVAVPASALAGAGRYAKLTVSAQSTGATPPVAIEQFNLQSSDRVQYGFDEGWYEPEYNPRTAQSWRWMSEQAIVRVHHAGRNVVMKMSGESPRRYFSHAPRIRVSVGDRVLSELAPTADFTADISIPADALTAANGRLVITSNQGFVAGEREGTGDRRRLAIRVYSLSVEGK